MKHNLFSKTIYPIIYMALLLLIAAFVSLRYGSSYLTIQEFFNGLFCLKGFETQSIIIYNVRLPRVIGAILSGIGLSVSGVLLQNITGNSLAGPNIIGVNAGAGFAAIMIMFFLPNSVFILPVGAFLGAFAASVIIVLLAAKINSSKSTVILAGVAITALLNAGISLVSLLEPDLVASYNSFSVGGLSGVRLKSTALPALIILIGFAVAVIFSKRIDIFCLGDIMANSLGVKVVVVRVVCLIIASACAASVVSFAGLLGFVGLIVPHMARKFTGFNTKYQLIYSVFIGSILVLVADLLGRVLFSPSELPVGTVMAFIGAPFFFWLLIKRRNYADL